MNKDHVSEDELEEDTSSFANDESFGLRLAMSLVTGRKVSITAIREKSGLRDYEVKLLSLLKLLSPTSIVTISSTQTELRFVPGHILGGTLQTFDCGKERCISYFLNVLVIIAPFSQKPFDLKLTGVTNKYGERSVEAIRLGLLPVYKQFVGTLSANDEPCIKTNAQGFYPLGGGRVIVQLPNLGGRLKNPTCDRIGAVVKIRGTAYVCKGSAKTVKTMADYVTTKLQKYCKDVFVLTDFKNGFAGGLSPGFGLVLSAYTNTGAVFQAEYMTKPKSKEDVDAIDPVLIAKRAYHLLVLKMRKSGAVDSCARNFTTFMMGLSEYETCCLFGSSFDEKIFKDISYYTDANWYRWRDSKPVYPYKKQKRRDREHKRFVLGTSGMKPLLHVAKVCEMLELARKVEESGECTSMMDMPF